MKLFFRNLIYTFLFTFISISIIKAGSGKISGRVTDTATGEPLVGVNIMLEGRQLGAATDIDGYYFIINIEPGVYTMVASYVGYEQTTIEKITVRSDLTSKVDFEMSMTSISTKEIIVTAKEPPIQKDLTSSLQSFSSADIDAAPIEEIQELLVMQAGI